MTTVDFKCEVDDWVTTVAGKGYKVLSRVYQEGKEPYVLLEGKGWTPVGELVRAHN